MTSFNPFTGYQSQEESRTHQDKGDIIDLDDANFDTPDLKIDKISKPKTHALILDQDSDETDNGPSDDIFDNVDEYENAPVFKLASNEIKLDDSRTVIQAVTDDEDVSQGSGSGDTEIEIEEDPDIFNTTDVADETGKVKSGKFGHQVNSDTYLQTVEIQMRRLLMSRLIRIFTVCLVNLFLFQ